MLGEKRHKSSADGDAVEKLEAALMSLSCDLPRLSGRDMERDALEAFIENASRRSGTSESAKRSMYISGAPGSGKSALVGEVRRCTARTSMRRRVAPQQPLPLAASLTLAAGGQFDRGAVDRRGLYGAVGPRRLLPSTAVLRCPSACARSL